MFRFFETLIDPYAPYPEQAAPPDRFWPFMNAYLKPARRVMVWTVLSVFAVALIEIWLIWYAGRIVDVLGNTAPSEVWARHGLELALVAGFILIARPVIQTLSALLLNQSLMPNVGTIVRWRANRHVLNQSVGWFQNDFAGRIANRMMQTAPAVGEATFQTFDAIVYAIIYLGGALWLLAGTDPRLAVPLILWLGLYVWLVAWTIPGSAAPPRPSPTPARRSPAASSTAIPTSPRSSSSPIPTARRPMPARRSSMPVRPSWPRCGSSR